MTDQKERIVRELESLSRTMGVKVLYAVESGSRAWGFASPDSDYDVRFIYVREKEDYLRLDMPKDVIEWCLDDLLDINGWDLKKALFQFHRSNAVLFEWSNSPIIYKNTEEWKKIYETAKGYFSVKAASYQYYGVANSTWKQYLQEPEVSYKKYFYALRPLLACRYIQEKKCPPPVAFDQLMTLSLPEYLRESIEFLLDQKKKMREKETKKPIPVIHDFIAQELIWQKNHISAMKEEERPGWEMLNQAFLSIL